MSKDKANCAWNRVEYRKVWFMNACSSSHSPASFIRTTNKITGKGEEPVQNVITYVSL